MRTRTLAADIAPVSEPSAGAPQVLTPPSSSRARQVTGPHEHTTRQDDVGQRRQRLTLPPGKPRRHTGKAVRTGKPFLAACLGSLVLYSSPTTESIFIYHYYIF
jgi:hypothetical protein